MIKLQYACSLNVRFVYTQFAVVGENLNCSDILPAKL